MAALTKQRNTPEYGGNTGPVYQETVQPVAASTKIFAGSLVCLNASGLAVPGAAATTLRAWGRAEAEADNSAGSASAISAKIRAGVFKWANSSAGDAIAQADVGNICYVVDDQTVAKTDGTGTRSKAGVIMGVESDGVWVQTGPRAIGL